MSGDPVQPRRPPSWYTQFHRVSLSGSRAGDALNSSSGFDDDEEDVFTDDYVMDPNNNTDSTKKSDTMGSVMDTSRDLDSSNSQNQYSLQHNNEHSDDFMTNSWNNAGVTGVPGDDANQSQTDLIDEQRDMLLDLDPAGTMTRQDLISLSYEEYKPPRQYNKPPDKIKSRSSSVVIVGGVPDKCRICGSRIYEMEKLVADKEFYHKQCFRCYKCQQLLNLGSYVSIDGQPHCKSHMSDIVHSKPRMSVGEFNASQSKPVEKSKPSRLVRSASVPYSAYTANRPRQDPSLQIPTLEEPAEDNSDLAAISEAFNKFKVLEKENSQVVSDHIPKVKKNRISTSWQSQKTLEENVEEEKDLKLPTATIMDNYDDDLFDPFTQIQKVDENQPGINIDRNATQPLSCNGPLLESIDKEEYSSERITNQETEKNEIISNRNSGISTSGLVDTDECNQSIHRAEAFAKFKQLELENLNSKHPFEKKTLPTVTHATQKQPVVNAAIENRTPVVVQATIENKPPVVVQATTENKPPVVVQAATENKPPVVVQATTENKPPVVVQATIEKTSNKGVEAEVIHTPKYKQLDVADSTAKMNGNVTESIHRSFVSFPFTSSNKTSTIVYDETSAKSANQTNLHVVKPSTIEHIDGQSQSKAADKTDNQSLKFTQNLLPKWKLWEQAYLLSEDNIATKRSGNSKYSKNSSIRHSTGAININQVPKSALKTSPAILDNESKPKNEHSPSLTRQQDPPPRYPAVTLAFTRHGLAKFKEIEARALSEKSNTYTTVRKTFKWDVKETASRNRQISIIEAESTIVNDLHSNGARLPDVVADQSSMVRVDDYPSYEDMKSILRQFRAMEDSTLPPPLPTISIHRTSSSGLHGGQRQTFYDRPAYTNELPVENMNYF